MQRTHELIEELERAETTAHRIGRDALSPARSPLEQLAVMQKRQMRSLRAELATVRAQCRALIFVSLACLAASLASLGILAAFEWRYQGTLEHFRQAGAEVEQVLKRLPSR